MHTDPIHRRSDQLILLVVIAVIMSGVFVSSWLAREAESNGQPLTDETIVAELGSFQRPYPQSLREAAVKARARPDDMIAAALAARAYLEYGRQIGDARLVGTALGWLEPWLERPSPHPDILVLAATALQYNHDFDRALRLLGQALAADPRNTEALLIRADLRTVQGRLGEAHQDCIKLPSSGRIDLGLICEAMTKGLTADGPRAYGRLEALMQIRGGMAPELTAYANGLLGEIAFFWGWPEKARAHLAAAYAERPDDLRTQLVYADVLLAQGDPSAALNVIESAPATDGIQLRRAIIQSELGHDGEVETLSDALRRTFELQRELGLTLHAREEARFQLRVVKDPAIALERAQANWEHQREFEDAQLLIDAAVAAGDPAAARPVLDWMREEKVAVAGLRIPDSVRHASP